MAKTVLSRSMALRIPIFVCRFSPIESMVWIVVLAILFASSFITLGIQFLGTGWPNWANTPLYSFASFIPFLAVLVVVLYGFKVTNRIGSCRDYVNAKYPHFKYLKYTPFLLPLCVLILVLIEYVRN